MNIHHDLEAIKMVAIEDAKEHNCNYNIIIVNPNPQGIFDVNCGSTYEFVTDSYFDKPRPNAILLHKTDDLILAESKKQIGKIGIIGAGNFARTIMHMEDSNPAIIVNSKVNAPETMIPSAFSEPFTRMINIDDDVFTIKNKKVVTNFTPKKKKRKK